VKIGLIGVGNIAKKAYIPIYQSMQGEHEFIVSSRKLDTAEKIRQQYQFTAAVEGTKALITLGVEAVFIHAKTSAHARIVREFLEAGIHVFVDKPVTENYQETQALYSLAREKNVLLMAGFNRRFAPQVAKLEEVDKNLIFVSKNRVNENSEAAWLLYDLYIHPLDTALYLLGEAPIEMTHKLVDGENGLERIVTVLETVATTAVVSMNLKSGANTETIEVQTEEGSYRIEDLTTSYFKNAKGTQIETFSDWDTTLYKRGFEPMVTTFLQAVAHFNKLKERQESDLDRGNGSYEDIMEEEEVARTEIKSLSPWDRIEQFELKQNLVLKSHAIIAEIIAKSLRHRI